MKHPQHSVCFQERPLVIAVRHALPYLVGLSLALAMVQTASSRSSDSAAAFTATQLVRQFTLKNTVSQVSMGMQGYLSEINGEQRGPAMGARPAGFPSDMGSVPATVNLPRRDGAGRPLGYCAWDNAAAVTSADYNAGQGALNPLVYAIVSPGLNGNMQTTCANVLAAGVGVGDDHVQVVAPMQVSSVQYKSAVATFSDLPPGVEGDIRLVRDTNKLYSYVGGAWAPVQAGPFEADAAGGVGAISYTTGKVTVADFQAATATISGATTITGALSGSSATFTGAVTANTFTGNGAGLVDLNAGNFSTGVVSPQFGGTGVNGAAAANGTLLIGNGSGFTLGTLTAGAGISVLNDAGAITLVNSGVVSITGTADQVIASASNGNVVLSLPQAIAPTSMPTFAGMMLNGGLTGTNATFSGAVTMASLNAQRIDVSTSAGGVAFPNMIVGTGAMVGVQSSAGPLSGANTALGINALNANTTGYANTGSGYRTLELNTTGYGNTANGSDVLRNNATGHENTASGYFALSYNTTGYGNTAMGRSSGFTNTTGWNNTFLGAYADATTGALSYAAAIGAGSKVATSNTIVLGRNSTEDQVVIGTNTRNDTFANTKLYVNGVTNLNGDLRGTTATFSGAVNALSFTGDGSGLNNLNASNFTLGIVPVSRGGTGLDGSAAPNGSLLIGNGTGYSLNTLTGTANQVNVTNGAGTITLSLPQSIATTSTPTFGGMTSNGAITFWPGTGNKLNLAHNGFGTQLYGFGVATEGGLVAYMPTNNRFSLRVGSTGVDGTEVFSVSHAGLIASTGGISTTTGAFSGNVTVGGSVTATGLVDAYGGVLVRDGSTLEFGPAGSTSDQVLIQRSNPAVDQSRLQIILGDNNEGFGQPVADEFQIGNNAGGTFTPRFRVAGSGDVIVSGSVTANSFSGNGSALTNLNANNFTAGTLPVARGGTGLSATPINGQLLIGNGTGYTLGTLTGTANQVNVTNGAGTITLSLPQAIATTSTPTFGGMTLNGGLTGTTATFSGLASAASLQATTATAINVQGAYLQWNRDGGRTFLVNQKGLGGGGISFGEVTTGNAYTENMALSSTGNLTVVGSVTASGGITGTTANFSSNLAVAGTTTLNGAVAVNNSAITFNDVLGDKLKLYSGFGFGINGDNLTSYIPGAGQRFSLRTGGNFNGTEVFTVTGGGLITSTGGISTTTGAFSGLASAATLQANQTTSINQQGAYLQWNRGGADGRTYLVNQRGSGLGGISFGESTTGNAYTQNMLLDASGNLSVVGSVTANSVQAGAGNFSSMTLTGALTGTSATFSGDVTAAGALQATSFKSITSQGTHIQWNRSGGDGRSYFVNQKGLGSAGGMSFGEATTGNVYTQNMLLDASGNLSVVGSVTANSMQTGNMTLTGALTGTTAAFSSAVVGNTLKASLFDAINSQGAYLQWNRGSGDGRTYLVNQRGGGSGGISFGESTTGNVYTENMALSSTGNLTVVGAVTANSFSGTTGAFSGNTTVGGTLGVTGATTLTGALTANGGISSTTGAFSGLASAASLQATTATAINVQGAYLQWNRDGGRTFLVNQKGLGGGGISFGEATTGNAYTENMALSSTGNLTVVGSVTANSFTGNGSGLTNLNSSNFTTGTMPVARGGTGLSATPTNGQLLIGNGTGYTLGTLTGTANQVNVTNDAGTITLSLPQNIATTSTPTFGGMTLNGGTTVNNSTITFNNVLGDKLNLFSTYGFGINSGNLTAYIPSGAERFSVRTGGNFNGTEVFTVTGGGLITSTGGISTSTGAFSGAVTVNGTLTANGASIFNSAVNVNNNSTVTFNNALGDKLNLFSGYGFGINGSNLTAYVPNATTRFSVRTGGTYTGTEVFSVSGAGNTSVSGTLGVTGATTLTGALTANGGISSTTGAFSGLASAASLQATTATAINVQGAYLQWNRDGGRTFLVNQKGLGGGGISFGEVTTGNAYTENMALSSTGNLTVVGSVTANSFTGNGSGLTNLNSSNFTTGTMPVARGGTGLSATPTNGQLLIGNGTGYTLGTLTGTANQVNVTNGAGTITLSLPQNIATTSTPTFGGMTLNGGTTVNNSTITFNDVIGDKLNLYSGFGFGVNGNNLTAYVPTAGQRFGLRSGGNFNGTEVFSVTGGGLITSTGGISTTTGTFSGNLSVGGNLVSNLNVSQGNFVRFGHANQLNGDDGKIGAGLFGEGLNIVGTKTAVAGSREVLVFGNTTLGGTLGVSGNTTLTGALAANGGITSTTGAFSGLASAASLQATTATSINQQGAYLQWNKDGGSGRTYLVNQRGGGAGGMSFGEVTTGNAYTENMTLSSTGNLVAAGSITGASLSVSGNVNGNSAGFGSLSVSGALSGNTASFGGAVTTGGLLTANAGMQIPTAQTFRFGVFNENTDDITITRLYQALDASLLRVSIGDGPGGIGGDEFQIGSVIGGVFSAGLRVAPGNGDVVANGYMQATSFNATSDRRLKKNITAQENNSVLERLEQLQTYSYEYINTPSVGRRIGVIAQEIQSLFPEAVSTSAETGMMSVDYNALGAMAAMGVGQLNSKFKVLDGKVNLQGEKLLELDGKLVQQDGRIGLLETWKTAAVTRMDGMQNAIDLNIQKIADNAVAIQTNTKAIERLDDALFTLDGTVKGNTESIANINARWARNFSASEDGSVLSVSAVELRASNFTAQQVRANAVYSQRLEAEIARIADLEVNNLRANSAVANTVQAEQVNTGSVQVYAGVGMPAMLFAAKADGHYTVSTSSLDGSYATATVIVNAGQAKVVSGASEGIELVAEGNMVKAIAAGKSIKASWIKMG